MRLPILFLLLFLTNFAFSQLETDTVGTNGLNEKPVSKHLFTLDGAFAFPLIDIVSRKNKSNDSYKHYLNWGINLSYVYSKSNRLGLGLEYGFNVSKTDFTSLGAYQTYLNSLITTDELNLKHEGLNLKVQTLMPKIEWKMLNSNRPNGFIHQVGIGVTMTNVQKRDYNYELLFSDLTTNSDPYSYDYKSNDAEENYEEDQLYDFKNKSYFGGTLMYSFSYRGSFSTALSWSVGIRSQINVTKAYFDPFKHGYQSDEEDLNYWITRREMANIIALSRSKSMFSLVIGLVYSL